MGRSRRVAQPKAAHVRSGLLSRTGRGGRASRACTRLQPKAARGSAAARLRPFLKGGVEAYRPAAASGAAAASQAATSRTTSRAARTTASVVMSNFSYTSTTLPDSPKPCMPTKRPWNPR